MIALYAVGHDRLERVGCATDMLHASMAGRWLRVPAGFVKLYAVMTDLDPRLDRAEPVELVP